MDEMFAGLEQWQLILFIIVGALLLLFGYRIKKAAFFLIWFAIGFLLIRNAMPWINSSFPDIANQQTWQFILPLGGGLLAAMLGFTVEKLCVGGICFGLIMMVAIQQFGTEMNVIAIAAILGVLAAGMAVMMMKPATIIATTLAGAFLIVSSLPYLVTMTGYDNYRLMILIGATVVGSIVQFFTTKHVS
ncbi:DUF4203 domain-containing protein [Candidatus Saccharibacteria bacterium]|nr:DUF4203 domain-containing protein [Candidatus Saccharibacteria bacterium]